MPTLTTTLLERRLEEFHSLARLMGFSEAQIRSDEAYILRGADPEERARLFLCTLHRLCVQKHHRLGEV